MNLKLTLLTLTIGYFTAQSLANLDRISEVLSNKNWAFEDKVCSKESMSFSFDITKKIVTLTLIKSIQEDSVQVSSFNYSISNVYKDGFRSKIENEKRLDLDGKQVEWDLTLLNDSTFFWSRADWEKGYGTKLIVRCTN